MFSRLKCTLTLLALLALCAAPAAAEPLSWETLKGQVDSLILAGDKDKALATLLANENQLSGQPDYDYALGVIALDLGQAGLAQSALERVVLMSPNHAGAWMDLAIASYQLGEFDRAQQIIDHLDQNFNPAASLKTQLSQVRRKLSYRPLIQGWRGSVAMLYGHDTNINSGLSNSNFYLTLGAGAPVLVEVADSQLPIADQALQGRGNAYRLFQHENGAETMVAGSLLLKEYISNSDFNYADAAVVLNYRRPMSVDKNWLINLGGNARYIYFGGRPLGHFVTASAGVSKKMGQCELGGRVDMERRTYTAANYFDATIPWVGLAYGCQNERFVYGLGLRYGYDKPDSLRPGGDTARIEGNAFVRGVLNPNLAYSLLIYAADYRDQLGFSEIINNNANRHIRRFGQRLELQYALPKMGPNWSAQLELENSKDGSNLPLARIDGQQVWLGLRYQLF
jgi:tetratricopeptide (TPR) repeat protein